MQTNDEGKNLITQFEGIRYVAYKDDNGYYTIGIGHKVILPYEHYLLISELSYDQVMQLFYKDLAIVEKYVTNLTDNWQPTQNQFNALCDFVYQYGTNLEVKYPHTFNIIQSGDINNICSQLLDFTNESLKDQDGRLTKRRNTEINLLNIEV